MKLSEEQRQLIIAEERLRNEIRKEIEKKESNKKEQGKLLAFLNSNVGIFLLSSVFLSLFSWSYTTLKYKFDESKNQKKLFVKLGREIANRIFYIKKIGCRYENHERAVIQTAIFGLNKGNLEATSVHPAYSPLYTEFRDIGLISLLWQLESMVVEEDKQKITSARKVAQKIPDFFWKSNIHSVDEHHAWWVMEETDSINFRAEVILQTNFLLEPSDFIMK